jgi:hypothetical protein
MILRLAFALIVISHALIHLLGFAKAYGWTVPLQVAISRPIGLLWFLAALSFGAAAILCVVGSRWWWLPAAPAVLLSQALIVLSWSDAKFGTIANLLIVLGLTLTLLDSSNSSFRKVFRREVERRLTPPSPRPPLSEAELAHLPPALRKYLVRAGVVGQPPVENLRATFRGEIRRNTEAGWLQFEAEQYSFFREPARLFSMRASRFGIPFDALHLYLGPSATMQVQLASLLRVVDARGPEMNRSETVTMFNDMCLLAPATLVDRSIAWLELDETRVKGTFTNAGNTISAVLSFDEAGDLANFVSDDRYQSSDGKTYEHFRWSTPVSAYRDFGGVRLASRGEATWRMPSGEFSYVRLEILSVVYNVSQ